MTGTEFTLIVLGALVGWLGCQLCGGEKLPPSSVVNMILGVAVGLLIQRELKKRGELERVPLGAFAQAVEQLDSHVFECLKIPTGTVGHSPQVLKCLSAVENDVEWLRSTADQFEVDATDFVRCFLAFRMSLSLHAAVDLREAEVSSRRLRSSALSLHWRLCRTALDDPTVIDRALSRPVGTVTTVESPGIRRNTTAGV